MTDLSNRLIISQQQQIAALRAQNKQLQEDIAYLKKAVCICIRDNGTLVLNRERMDAERGEFDLNENVDGDTLVRMRRAI